MERGLSISSRGSEVTSLAPPTVPASFSVNGTAVCSVWVGSAGSILGCISVALTRAAGFSVATATKAFSVTLAAPGPELSGADGRGRDGGRGEG